MPIDGDGTDGDRPGGCWRNQLDSNLKRFHSLLFSIDRAIEKSDFASAHILGVRLLGFLESRIETPVDEAFIAPIHAEVSSKIASCLRSLAPHSDRRAFEQAKREESDVFVKRGGFDVEKVKKSQLFQRFIGMSSGSSSTASSMVDCKSLEKLNAQSKLAVQAKIVSASDDVMLKQNNLPSQNLMGSGGRDHEECMIVSENMGVASHNYLMSNSVNITLHGDDDGRIQVISTKHKRRNIAFTNPVCGNVKASSKNLDGCGAEVAKGFVTAKEKMEMDMKQKHGCKEPPSATVSPKNKSPVSIKNYRARSGGLLRRGLRGNFVPPIRSNGGSIGNVANSRNSGRGDDLLEDSTRRCMEMLCGSDGELPEKLRNLEPHLIEHISNEIMDKDPNVRWDDIAGLEHAKKCVTEMVVWPLLRPDLFRGCRSPGRGLLLFGPPGTGKTMVGKAIAGESKATFFYISASSLTSKWIGEGEKLVRALFGVASCRQPAVIFVDEIDSLLSQRKSDGEHESSRRLKTQLLIEMEGFDSGNEQILLIGATNRPQELDEAARRRLTKRLYIPLPSSDARAWIIQNLLEKDGLFKLGKEDIASICKLTEGYSGSDMKNLVKDASMGPLREAMRKGSEITKLRNEDMRVVNVQDFEDALQEVRPSVSPNELDTYEDWNKQFGSLSM